MAISEQADSFEIKRSFRQLAKKYHPDKNNSDTAKEYFQLINEAHQILTDPVKRMQYDLSINLSSSKSNHFDSRINRSEKYNRKSERQKANYEYSYQMHKAPEIWMPPKIVKVLFYFVGLLFGILVNYFSILSFMHNEWNPAMLLTSLLATIVFLDAIGGLFIGEALFSERIFKIVRSWFVPRF